MQRAGWFSVIANARGEVPSLPRKALDALAKLDDALFGMWDLGDNVVLAWTHLGAELRFLAVRHYAIAEAIHGGAADPAESGEAESFINEVLSGPKYLPSERFAAVCRAFRAEPRVLRAELRIGSEVDADLTSELVRRYSVSLVRDRAVVLLDAVEFSLATPLDQMAMLNSLSYSVNSAYQQLLSKDIRVNFARTTTGDGFQIWNRNAATEGDIELYKLMMMILADNAIAHSKASGGWVPRLRAAFHVGEHYEFHQIDGLNPTTFSYIVGQVTIDLSRMIDKALPGQILLGHFSAADGSTGGALSRHDTPDFVERTAATLDQLNGLMVSGGWIESIRCYLTGQSLGAGRYLVNRYHIRDKHGTTRVVYNAKINIHRENADPIFLGIQREQMGAFPAARVESLDRDTESTGSLFIRP
jgi:hypothetical protein